MRKATAVGEIRALTGLRGVAACYVVLYHYFQHLGHHGRAGVGLLHGYLSVDLFFVLSGFVMALTYAQAFSGGFPIEAYRAFIFKRLARIYPLYLVATLVGLALAENGGEGGVPSLFTVIANILLVNAWGAAPSVGGPTWSISTEFAAYLVFPILVAVVLRGQLRAAWVAALLALAALTLVATRSDLAVNEVAAAGLQRNGPLDVWGANTPYPVLRCLAGFTLGLFAFRLAGLPRCRDVARGALAGDALVLTVVVLLFVPASDVLTAALFVPLIVCLSQGASYSARLLGSGPIHWLGLVSYSIYLCHVLVDHAARRPVMAGLERMHVPSAYTMSSAVLLPAVIAVAAATYYGIEKPARSWGRRLIHARRRPIASEPSAP